MPWCVFCIGRAVGFWDPHTWHPGKLGSSLCEGNGWPKRSKPCKSQIRYHGPSRPYLMDHFHSHLQPPASGKQSPTKNGSPSRCPRFLKVKNWETDVVLTDTLHLKSTLVSVGNNTSQEAGGASVWGGSYDQHYRQPIPMRPESSLTLWQPEGLVYRHCLIPPWMPHWWVFMCEHLASSRIEGSSHILCLLQCDHRSDIEPTLPSFHTVASVLYHILNTQCFNPLPSIFALKKNEPLEGVLYLSASAT